MGECDGGRVGHWEASDLSLQPPHLSIQHSYISLRTLSIKLLLGEVGEWESGRVGGSRSDPPASRSQPMDFKGFLEYQQRESSRNRVDSDQSATLPL